MSKFNITECKGIKSKIQFIEVYGVPLKLKYDGVLKEIIKLNIDRGNTEDLERAGIIKFNGKETANSFKYKSWVTVIPKRKDDRIDKIIRVLKVLHGNTEAVNVEFIGTTEEVIGNKEFRESQLIYKKLEEAKENAVINLFDLGEEISDEELMTEIMEESSSAEEFVRRAGNLNSEREGIYRLRIDRKFRHIAWILNDDKQAELFNVSVAEYREKFREANIHEEKEVRDFLEYLDMTRGKGMQSEFLAKYMCRYGIMCN